MKYFFEGNEISINDIQSAAVESLMTVEEYINKFNIEVVEEEPVNQTEDFQQAPQEETALVGPVEQTPAVDTVSVSEDTSLGTYLVTKF